MTTLSLLQIAVYFLLILCLVKPLGAHMARVFQGERTILHPLLRPLERLVYAAGGVDEEAQQSWKSSAGSLLAFSLAGLLLTFLLQRLQGLLPLNPQGFGAAEVPSDLAFNTAVSYVTNTNWQAYGGETTLSYLVQMGALTVQNFVSAAAGMAVAAALARGFSAERAQAIGNFQVDLVRATVYVLLPLSAVGALFLVSQGVVQNFNPYLTIKTIEGTAQVIPGGPAASQIAIKQLGTNGGGFFNANSAHPFENPTPWSNLLELIFILMIPAALTYTFGRMVGDTRQGWALFAAMSLMFLVAVWVSFPSEQGGSPALREMGVRTDPTAGQSGGNMEGKEVRFGIADSVLWSVATTAASNGSVNSMHDSFTPLAGLVALFLIQTGGVVFGGVGVGLCGALFFAILAVFIAGLMVGRTPEYLGKKIEQDEVKMIMLSLIATGSVLLVLTAASVSMPFAPGSWWNPPGDTAANIANAGPHGLAEILYACSSAVGNNGSAFAGLNANTPWYNLLLGLGMLVGRFLLILPVLKVAGSLSAKPRLASTQGTFPTHGPLFVLLLVGTIVTVGALTYLPVLSLSLIVEQFAMLRGTVY